MFIHHIVQKFQFFVIMSTAHFGAKTVTLYSCLKYAKSWIWILYYVKFCEKKLLISKEFAILCKIGFVWIQNWCKISCNKSYFVQKHVFTGAQELHTVSWKPYFFTHCWKILLNVFSFKRYFYCYYYTLCQIIFLCSPLY